MRSAPRRLSLFALLAALAPAGPVLAASYNETTQGDLSDNRLAPTALALSLGSNVISGSNGPSPVPDVPDLDYITVTLPAGTRLSQLVVLDSDVGGAVSFIAIEQGAQVSVAWNEGSAETLLGWAHYGSADEGLDILTAIGAGPGALGFVPPLPSATYTLWIMELDGARPYAYSFDLQVTQAPPSCPGDINQSGDVTFSDITFVLTNFAAPYTFADITTVLTNFGAICPP